VILPGKAAHLCYKVAVKRLGAFAVDTRRIHIKIAVFRENGNVRAVFSGFLYHAPDQGDVFLRCADSIGLTHGNFNHNQYPPWC
jgi:hypothetical protein